MKNSSNNNHPDLLPAAPSTKPVSGTHATAAQLASLLGFSDLDDTFLRNRVREGIIPKPRNNQYAITATTVGLLKWYRARAQAKSDLPAQYASTQAMENALGTNKKAIKWLLRNGAGEAQDPANRIAPLPVIRLAFDIIAQVADGAITGIAELEQWNHQTELAKKLRLEAEDIRHNQLIRAGETLFARDAEFAVSELVVDLFLWEKRDQPLRATLPAAEKTIQRQHRTILRTAAVAPEVIRQCDDVTRQALRGILDKLRAKIPKRLNLETVEAE